MMTIKNVPNYILREYIQFKEMMEQEKYAAAWVEYKDVIEVILKVPVLISAAYIYSKGCGWKEVDDMDAFELIGHRMLDNQMSLSKWVLFSDNYLVKSSDLPRVLKTILTKTTTFFDRNKVVHWRNESFAHGALSYESNKEFQKKLKDMSKKLTDYFEEVDDFYQNVSINIRDDNDKVEIKVEEQQFSMKNFVLHENGSSYLFNSLKSETHLSDFLNYYDGEKITKYVKLHSAYVVKKENNRPEKGSVRKSYQLESEAEELKKMNLAFQYEHYTELQDWLDQAIESHRKGIFLLSMDRGMGKTAFVSSMDQFLINRRDDNERCVRAYYCNQLQYEDERAFTEDFNAVFRSKIYKNDNLFRSNIDYLQIDSNGKKMAEILSQFQKVYDDEYRINKPIKLLYIIDGLDEIVPGRRASVFDFIPKADELGDNTYILLTCRNEDSEQLPDYIKDRLSELDITVHLDISIKSDDDRKNQFKKIMKSYLDKRLRSINYKLKINGREPVRLSTKYKYKLMERANYRFSDFQLYMDLITILIFKDESLDLLESQDNIVIVFLKYVEAYYGKKLCEEMIRILLILTKARFPLTLSEINYMVNLNEQEIPIQLLAILSDLKSFLIYRRTGVKTTIEIANVRYKEVIWKLYGDRMEEILAQWIYQIEQLHIKYINERNQVYGDEVYFSGLIYIHSWIYSYVKEGNYKKLWSRIHNVNFAQAIFDYEVAMKTGQLEIQVKQMDMEMSMAIIHILEDNQKLEGIPIPVRLYCGAVNNWLFHKIDQLKDYENSEEVKQTICGHYAHILDMIGTVTDPSYELKELKSKIHSSRGVFYNKLNMKDMAYNDFVESFKLRGALLKECPEKAAYLYIQSLNNILSLMGDNDCEKFVELFKNAKENIKWLKSFLNPNNTNPDKVLRNFRGRIEYGILLQEVHFYRKSAAVVNRIGDERLKQYDIEKIEELYNYCFNQLDEIKQFVGNNMEEISTILKTEWVIFYEAGCYYFHDRHNLDKAKDCFDKSIEEVNLLVQANKTEENDIRMLQNLYYWCQINSNHNPDLAPTKESEKMTLRLEKLRRLLTQPDSFGTKMSNVLNEMRRFVGIESNVLFK